MSFKFDACTAAEEVSKYSRTISNYFFISFLPWEGGLPGMGFSY